MIEIVAFMPDHAARIVAQLAQRDEMAGPIGGSAALGPAFSAIDTTNGAVLVVAGLAETRPDYATAWAVFAEDKHRGGIAIARATRGVIEATRYRRIDMIVRAGFGEAEGFARFLGFAREGLHRCYFADGGDAAIWALIREEF